MELLLYFDFFYILIFPSLLASGLLFNVLEHEIQGDLPLEVLALVIIITVVNVWSCKKPKVKLGLLILELLLIVYIFSTFDPDRTAKTEFALRLSLDPDDPRIESAFTQLTRAGRTQINTIEQLDEMLGRAAKRKEDRFFI